MSAYIVTTSSGTTRRATSVEAMEAILDSQTISWEIRAEPIAEGRTSYRIYMQRSRNDQMTGTVYEVVAPNAEQARLALASIFMVRAWTWPSVKVSLVA